MKIFKTIFLLSIFVSNSHSSNWMNDHAALVGMSWRSHWLEALNHMECQPKAGELTAAQRRTVFERFIKGRGRGEDILTADLDQAGNPEVGTQIAPDLSDMNYLDQDLFWGNVSMIEVLELGFIGSPFRDRRFAAGWTLDTIDILRQQPITNKLFDAEQYGDINHNDLLKVRGLSGTFWRWNGVAPIQTAKEMFSGMIQPNQEILTGTGERTVNILSCFHGLLDEDDIGNVYFLPAGRAPDAENFFRIMTVQRGEAGPLLAQAELDPLFEEYKRKDEAGEPYEDDFALIQVSNVAAVEHNTLRSILVQRQLFNETHNRVINLQGEESDHFEPDRIFVFGKPNHTFVQRAGGIDGFCLVSDSFRGNANLDLKNRIDTRIQTLLIQPLHKLNNLQEIYVENPPSGFTNIIPSPLRPLPEKFQAISIPLTHGMSGGPVLMCKIHDDESAPHSIKCRHVGVVNGGHLVQEDTHILYKGIIATI